MRTRDPVALALNGARRSRRETLRQASAATGLPVRYLAAFELEGAHKVFRSPEWAELFLRDYARYLELDERSVAEEFAARYAAVHPGVVSAPPSVPDGEGKDGRPGARREPLPPRRPAPPDRPLSRLASIPGRARRLPNAWSALPVLFLVTIAAVGVSGLGRSAPPPAPEPSPSVLRAEGPAATAATAEGSPPREIELPGGGRTIFPDRRVVALYGSPISHRLGRLGLGPPTFAAEALALQLDEYPQGGRPIMPALVLVTTLALDHPGPLGTYARRLPVEVVRQYLEAARGMGGLLVLDLQPGRSDFLTEAKAYEEVLREPDVGLALDPEWRVGPDQVPGRAVGAVSASEVNEVGEYLAGIVRSAGLPQKLFVIHQFRTSMVTDKEEIETPPELAVTFDIDGVGTQHEKNVNYIVLSEGPPGSHVGIKLYYERDVDLMTPREVLDLDPQPDLVIYQ